MFVDIETGVALHDIAQLCDVTVHSCGARLVYHFPPSTDMDGLFSFSYLRFIVSYVLSFDPVGCASEAEVAARQRSQAR